MSQLLKQAGVKMNDTKGGHVPVCDKEGATSVPGIYAAGDVSGIEEASSAMIEGRMAGATMSCYLGYLDAQYATGTYGPSTVEAVRAFQQATDKVPTGIANHHTQLTLQHIYEETYWQDDANFIVRDE